MIPLYRAVHNDQVPYVKNPIYFFRKHINRGHSIGQSCIVLNTEYRPDGFNSSDFLPQSYIGPNEDSELMTFQPAAFYDVEIITQASLYDAVSEPQAMRDGSIAGEPKEIQKVTTIRGFIRAENGYALEQGIDFLNYSFNPVINYIEDSSTFANTIAPVGRPFHNVGFGALAWSAYTYAENAENDPWQRLNRFMFARSISTAVDISTKFDDQNAPFSIELLSVDPTIYEFLHPSSGDWGSNDIDLDSGETVVKAHLSSIYQPGWRRRSGNTWTGET